MMDGAQQVYQDRIKALDQELKKLNGVYDTVAWSRLLTLLLAIALSIGTVWKHWGSVGWAACGLFAGVFIILVNRHALLSRQRDRAMARKAYYERGLQRLAGKWSDFAQKGQRYLKDDHSYALDLDLFGDSSLFQLLNDTRTALGEETLAKWLLEPASSQEIKARQLAIAELSEQGELRASVAVAGTRLAEQVLETEPLLRWAESKPALNADAFLKAFAWVSPAILVGLLIAGSSLGLPSWLAVIPFVLQYAVLFKLLPRLEPAIQAASQRAEQLERFAEIISILEEQAWKSESLKLLAGQLTHNGIKASQEIQKLSNRISILDARQNGAFKALIGPALMWDVHCVDSIEKWQRQAGGHIRSWLQALGQFEALVSLGSFAYEHPDYVFAELTDGALHWDAKDLGHPLIDEKKRVVNDVSLQGPGSVLLVTGSNMSGKSTLLRSIGVASVLALSGAPVCAKKLMLAPCVVRSSMRVSDSLRDGISRFYAELLKIKQVIAATDQGLPVLFLLDEILHGTNSRERHIGARAIIQTLAQRGAMGAVSTHDLALANLEKVLPDKLRTVHFQEQVVNGSMVFDYRLREGVVRSGNALRWMRLVGISVDPSLEQEIEPEPEKSPEQLSGGE